MAKVTSFIGASGSSWLTAGSWNNGIPVAGDTAYLEPDVSSGALFTAALTSVTTSFPTTLVVADYPTANGQVRIFGTGGGFSLTADATILNYNHAPSPQPYDFAMSVSLNGDVASTRTVYKTGDGWTAFGSATNNSNLKALIVKEGGILGGLSMFPVGSSSYIQFGDNTTATTLYFNINATTGSVTVTSPWVIETDLQLLNVNTSGATGIPLTHTGKVTLGSVNSTRVLTVSTPTTFQNLDGTTEFIKAGSQTLTLNAAATSPVGSNPFSGSFGVSAGTIAIATNTNTMERATFVGGAGTLTWVASAVFGGWSTNESRAINTAMTVGSTASNLSQTDYGGFSGSALITKAGTGTWTLNAASTHTGGFTVTNGILLANADTALGATTGALTASSTGQLQIGAGRTINKASAALSLGGVGPNPPANGALYLASGTSTLTVSSLTLSSGIYLGVATGARLTLVSAGSIAGAGQDLYVVRGGELALQTGNASNYNATYIWEDSTLELNDAPTGTLPNLGNSGTSLVSIGHTTVADQGAALRYKGAAAKTWTRALTFAGGGSSGVAPYPKLESSSTLAANALTYSGTITRADAGNVAFSGTNAGENTCSSNIGNATNAGAVSVVKLGTGKWNLTGSLTNTGGVYLVAGTLGKGAGLTLTYSAGNLNVSGGSLIDAVTAPIVATGGTINAKITSTSTLSVPSGTASITPLVAYTGATGSNTYTGATSIAGTCNATPATDPATSGYGKCFGDSAVTVSGTLKTSAGATPLGRMRYGGNLTFQPGATLSIGGAA